MFPPEREAERYNAQAPRKFPQAGDLSCRSSLTIHRGTKRGSPICRPVLVLGVDAAGAGHAALHDVMVTRDYHEGRPRC